MTRSDYIHATAVVWRGVGILFVGEAGSGKSSFAAELVARGGELVGDDQLLITSENAKIYAEVPAVLEGVLELRGVALITLPHVTKAQISIVVDCRAEEIEPRNVEILNITLPRIVLNLRDATAIAKLTLYAEALHEGRVLPEDWKP